MKVIPKNRYLIKEQIFVGQFFDDEEKAASITMREPNTKEILDLKSTWIEKKGDKNAVIESFVEYLPKLIIEHDFYESAEKLHTNESVAAIILEQIDCFTYVIGQYCDKVLFTIMPELTKKKTETGEEKTA